MDCRTCQPTLIDLLHGELATDAAEEAHEHLQRCSSCRGAMEKLSYALRVVERMPTLEPPQAVSTRLMQLAEDRAQAMAAQRIATARKPSSLWQMFIDFVGRFAMARQVGMVTIMLLIVAVGLWSLPRLNRQPAVAGETVVSPDPSFEATTSAGVQPAEPLDLQVDLRAGRIRSKEEESRMRGAQAPASGFAEQAGPAAGEQQAGPGALAQKRDPARALDDLDAPLLARDVPRAERSARGGGAEVKQGRAAATSARRTTARERAKRSSSAGSPIAQAFPKSAAQAKPKSAADAPEQHAVGAGASDAVARGASSEPRAEVTVPSAPPAIPQSASDLYVLGAERARAGDPSGALQAFRGAHARTTDLNLRRKAQLGVARATGAMRGCSAALSSYQQVVNLAPASAEAGDALIEMARCRTQQGDPAIARSLLERAAQIPQATRRANAMLTALPPAAESEPAAAESTR